MNNNSSIQKFFLITIGVCIASSLVFGFGAGFWASRFYTQKLFQQDREITKSESQQILRFSDTIKEDYEKRIINIVKNSEDAVVSVIATKDLPVLERYYINPFQDFYQEFNPFGFDFRIPQYRQKGTEPREINSGSGFVVTEDGYIITNRHVVEDKEARYTVLMNNGNKYSAKVIARDPSEDFAVLKIEKNDLKFLKLGDSQKLKLGQTVIAIGNALGEFKNTVSVGVISGLYRHISVSDVQGQTQILSDVIQTDAAINRGNSGGPLLNLNGEVIGINTAMVFGAQNIGFAIPIGKIEKALESAIKTGRITIPFLGVRYLAIDSSLKEEKKLPVDYGVLITSDKEKEKAIIPNSPAEKAGLKEGDIILEINGIRIDTQNSLASLIRYYQVGEEITLKVWRQGNILMIKVILGERKE